MIISWDVCVEYFEGRAAVEEFLMERSTLFYSPAGTKAISYRLGPGTRKQADLPSSKGRPDAELRIDLDTATGCGAARWYDGDLMAVEDGHGAKGFGTWTGEFEPVPYSVGRVSAMTALRLGVAYAETGERPTVAVPLGSLSWVECGWMNMLLVGRSLLVSNVYVQGVLMTKRLEGPHLVAVEGHIIEFGRYDLSWGLVCPAPKPPSWGLPGAGDREGGFFYQPVVPRGDDGPWEREYTVTVSVCRCACGDVEQVGYRRHLWETSDGRRWESTEILSGSLTSVFGLDVNWAHETNATGDLGEATNLSHLLM